MEKTLDCLQVGCTARITRIDTDASLESRLRCFGMVPGTNVYCRYRSPGGHVAALECRGSVLALRTRDMQKILGVLLNG